MQFRYLLWNSIYSQENIVGSITDT